MPHKSTTYKVTKLHQYATYQGYAMPLPTQFTPAKLENDGKYSVGTALAHWTWAVSFLYKTFWLHTNFQKVELIYKPMNSSPRGKNETKEGRWGGYYTWMWSRKKDYYSSRQKFCTNCSWEKRISESLKPFQPDKQSGKMLQYRGN